MSIHQITPQITPTEFETVSNGADAEVANESAPTSAEALMERVFESCIATMDVATIHLGRKLGLYRALVDEGPASAPELAERTGADERYVREWLEQQAVTGILSVDDAGADTHERRYELPFGHAEALLDHTSPFSVGPFAQFTVGELLPIDLLIEAFRTGDGVPYAAYPECREGQGEVNRGMFVHELGSSWIPAIPQVHAALSSGGGTVADIACGTGWSSIELARAYPKVRVDAFDLDGPSIDMARENLRDTGVEDRVEFSVADGARAGENGAYELVTIFEAVHDMARPVEVLRGAREALAEGGVCLVADEKVAHEFNAPGDELERLMYGYSVLFCLPTAREEQPSAATGTAMRPHTLEAYAQEAGFRDVETLPVDNDLWRFYLLKG